MITVTADVEAIILEIEKMKRIGYEYFNMTEGLENPDVLVQATSRLLGEQAGYDSVISYLRRLQGVVTNDEN